MTLNHLTLLLKEHDTKILFKWYSYIAVYERSLLHYRDRPINILEIGVLNGGSLELWAKYFSNAKQIIGCDTNPDCAKLSFNDSRISVLIGDATQAEVAEKLSQTSSKFDVVIDDGSHQSIDIIRSFVRIFPLLCDDGLYIIEDLHTSYWSQYGGGLYQPTSAMSFLKRLADVINHEHWGVSWRRAQVLEFFCKRLGVRFDESSLASIHSIEFVNSMCLIRKKPFTENLLGNSHIFGLEEHVSKGHLQIRNTANSFAKYFSQKDNLWTNIGGLPEEVLELTKEELELTKEELGQLRQEIMKLNQSLQHHVSTIEQIKKSYSWRLTAPLRWCSRIIFKTNP